MHRIDPMHRKQATDILLDFCHPHLRLEKTKVLGDPLNQKKSANMARILEKFLLRQCVLPPGLAWRDPFHKLGTQLVHCHG